MTRHPIKFSGFLLGLLLCCVVFILLSLNVFLKSHFMNPKRITATLYPPTIVNRASPADLNPRILQYVPLWANETKDPFVNLHSYVLRLNSHLCKFDGTFLVMVIHSAPEYFKKRAFIRSTYGTVNTYRKKKIIKVFLLGAVKNRTTQEKLEEESRIHGDIVQGNFLDTYKTLARKHIMGMHWYKHNCHAEYILKLDDDTFVNPYRLVDYIIDAEFHGQKMWCKVAKRYHPIRNPESKYYTPKYQYPYPIFPAFCLGFAYLTTPVVWDDIYRWSQTTRRINMDDVYVGILSMMAAVEKVDFGKMIVRCVGDNKMNLREINTKPFVFDPLSFCGDMAFRHWQNITS